MSEPVDNYPIAVKWIAGALNPVKLRFAGDNGTGTATGVTKEGNWFKQADISTITRTVYDRSSATPDVATATATLTVSSVVIDTPVTSTAKWGEDTTGYNWLDNIADTVITTAGHVWRVDYLVTTTGGDKIKVRLEGTAE